jgi:hypothetical protein
MQGPAQAEILLRQPGGEWIPVDAEPAGPVAGPAPAPAKEAAAPLDLDALEAEVETLLAGYRDVLHCAERLPLLGMVGNGRGKDGRRRLVGGVRTACRPIVRRLSERHVRRRLQALLHSLHVEALALPPTTPEGQRLHGVIARVEQAHHQLFGESAWRRFARQGWLPVLAVAGTSAATLLSGGQTSNLAVALPLFAKDKVEEQGAGSALGEGASTPDGEYVYLPDGLSFALTVLLLVALLAPLLVRWGFWAKRSLFLGGPVATWEVRLSRKPLFGFAVPERSCYAQEGRVFGLLGARRPREFPVDALLGLWTMVFLWLTAGMALYAWWDSTHASNAADVADDILSFWVFLTMAALSTLTGVVGAARRRREGTC